jgi:hypothetical protein
VADGIQALRRKKDDENRSSSSLHHRVATIPGNGIGKEVIPAGQKVLEALYAADKSS